MKKIIRIFCIIIAIFAILVLSSCVQEQAVSGITLVLDRANINMSVGDVYNVSWSTIPASDRSAEVSWRSSNEAVAICDGGVVRAVGEGRAIITATHSSGAYDVVSITVQNGRRKLFMMEGEIIQLKSDDLNAVLQDAECVSTDPKIAEISQNESGVIVNAGASGRCHIKLEADNASIVYCDLIVFSGENSGVNIEIDEFPIVVNYDVGRYQSAVEITNISVEKRNGREFLDQQTVQVELVYDMKKVYDSDGDDALNPTVFFIEVYSAERDGDEPIKVLEVHSDWIKNGETRQFVYVFNVDFELGDGDRNFTFKIKEIGEKE